MTPEEIRSTFGHNEVYPIDEGKLAALQVLATGELAAQIAELNRNLSIKTALEHGGGYPDGY